MKKIFIFIFLIFGFVISLTNNIKAQTYESNVNLISPDLKDKEYLGDGLYRLYDAIGITIDYNVYSGIYNINGETPILSKFTYILTFADLNFVSDHIFFFEYLNGTTSRNLTSEFKHIDNTSSYLNLTHSVSPVIKYNIKNYRIYLIANNSYSFNNYQFRLHLEEGDYITYYTVPLQAAKQHEQFIYNNGYNNGLNNDYLDGWNDGFTAGLDEAFNENNLMFIAENKGKGTVGPSMEFIGFNIPINKKVKNITILNLYGYSLKDLSYMVNGVKQGLGIYYENGYEIISFKSQYDEFEEIMEFTLERNEIIESIDIILALNIQISESELETMLNNMRNNLGFYINNKILNDTVIDRFKEVIKNDYLNSLDLEELLQEEFDKGWDKGFDEGVASNSDFSFVGLLTQIFTGLGSFLAIQLLPNITIGAIIAVPIVFGIIAFIIGKRGGKDD